VRDIPATARFNERGQVAKIAIIIPAVLVQPYGSRQ
jgi:hypothetical protein